MNSRCMFLGGPADGEMKIIPDGARDWFIAERKVPRLIEIFKPMTVDEVAYIKHRYVRTTAKTFLHEDENQPGRMRWVDCPSGKR
jgi:hypothetical protein